MASFYFLYQRLGGEEHWNLELADKREQITADIKPAFVSVLDLSAIPTDNDWAKVKYRGPMYFDFDADGDIPLVCEKFREFLGKIAVEVGFDISQATLWASGGKGFHIEIPQECFLPSVPIAGTPWLPYVYRELAQALIVDTMDLRVYTGKRGRMWRTPDVQRDNGNYKVSITLEEALSMTSEAYAEIVSQPRARVVPTPAHCNSTLAMMFETAKGKMTSQMRGKKKRQQAASAVLDPWRKAKRHLPTVEGLMAGTNVAEGVGFQQLSMQLAIYAVAMDMTLDDFLEKSKGLCESHLSDSYRYNTAAKRQEELARMWRYMSENSLYDFDSGPLIKLVKPGTPVADLGVMEKDDTTDTPRPHHSVPAATDDSAVPALPIEDAHKGVRRGFFMNRDGMWKAGRDFTESMCRANLRQVEGFFDLERKEFKGYEFDISVKGRKDWRAMLGAEAFASAAAMKKFFVGQQISFQGGEPETTALLDIMAEKASKGGRTYVYPREGFFIEDNPEVANPEPVKIYLTQDTFLSSVKEGDDDYFRLRYRPSQAISAYNIDLHKAPILDETMAAPIHDLFAFNRADVVANLLGWMVAAHYRSVYMHAFHQFPMLQVYGAAGSGKTQTIMMLAHLHWYMTPVSVKSAMSCTNFAMDSHASSSTSAPFILDEYKPRVLKSMKGRLEKIKDVFKMSYTGGDIGERGTLNRGAENHLAIIKSKATAPIVFMGEAVEVESAIVERSVTVMLSESFHTRERQQAFLRLQQDPSVLSAIGRAIIEAGFRLNVSAMSEEVIAIRESIEAKLPAFDDESLRRMAPRLVYNRAVVIHGLSILQRVLHKVFGAEFDGEVDTLLARSREVGGDENDRIMQTHSMSELSKVLSRVALLSREIDAPYEMKAGAGKDYYVGDGWVEVKVERAYDNYRRYCASINDVPLFDNLEAFSYALDGYSPCIDKVCASSSLRASASSERVVRFDSRKLLRQGVQTFRS